MEKQTQIEFLKQKFVQLTEQYLAALNNGKSLQEMQDLSDVLNSIRQEIEIFEQGSVSGKNTAQAGGDQFS